MQNKEEMNELSILMTWHIEKNPHKIRAYEENKMSFSDYNPKYKIITIKNLSRESPQKSWLDSDLRIFRWYATLPRSKRSERYLLVEWDCWCDCNLYQYFCRVWDCNVVAPCIKYPERDDWVWFATISRLPPQARKFATGIVPFCGILLSDKAMNMICKEILKPEYDGLNSEIRMATIATMLGLDPVTNPVCNRSITWRTFNPFDLKYKGLHHPRKKIIS